MKLVHLFKYYWPDNGGGIAAAMDMVIHAFNEYSRGKTGYRQEIVCCWQEAGKDYKLDEYNGIPVHRCRSMFEFASTQFSPQFISKVNKETEDADIVIHNFPYPFVDLAILLRKVHGKLVVWWHCDFKTTKGKLLTKLYTPLVKHTLKKADAIIVSAKGNIDGSDILKPFESKCHVIPFAVSDEMAKNGRDYFRNKTETNGKIHILFIGRFVWYKGIDILLKAYKQIENENYELTLIGNGPLLEKMKGLADELKLQNVQFTGSVSEKDKIEWIKWSDFLVLPSISKAEAFAIVQIEAMSYGKPVINTNLPSGVPDVCPNGVAGTTIDPGSVSELAKAIEELSSNDQLRDKYSKNAIELVEEKYTMSVLDENYRNLFNTFIE